MKQDSGLKDVFNEGYFLEMLPLIHWLQVLGKEVSYQPPPLRACFIFDDPNLHWPSYGFVDFQEIATHASRENYHVSFATIPLDGWFIHDATAELFRTNPQRLSLVVHGNDHVKQELAQRYEPHERIALLRQALRRIERLEKKSGIQVCRVMVPPHGACSEDMLKELPGCGFEAACISHGSLRAHNRNRDWTRTVGYLPSETIRGCPVIPRWGFAGDTQNTILLAAFLHQPIVLRGHHQDLKNGVGLLDELARFINGLGPVTWARIGDISKMNYGLRMQEDVIEIQPLSRKATIRLPENARRLRIDDPRHEFGNWNLSTGNGSLITLRPGEPAALPEKIRTVMIETPSDSSIPDSRPTRRRSGAILRRLLTEGRDRLLPLAGRR